MLADDLTEQQHRQITALMTVLRAHNPMWAHRRVDHYRYGDNELATRATGRGPVIESTHWALHLNDRHNQ